MKTDPHENVFCENEHAVVHALLSGALTDDLLAHIGGCPVCREVTLVSQSLLHEVASAPEDLHVPDASLVWRRAQTLARQQAIAKATQPIRIARICAYVAAILGLPWLVIPGLNSSSWMPDLGRSLSLLDHSLSPTATATFALGILGSLAVISVSSWYVLRQE